MKKKSFQRAILPKANFFCLFCVVCALMQVPVKAQNLTVNGQPQPAPFIGVAGTDYTIVAPNDILTASPVVTLQGGQGSIRIKDGVTLESSGDSALLLYGGASYQVTNTGTLTGATTGVNAALNSNGGSLSFDNDGTLTGNYGIYNINGARTTINNSGVISGSEGGIVSEVGSLALTGSSAISITNSSLIQGLNRQAIQSSATAEFGAVNSSLNVENTGTLEGHLGALLLVTRSSQLDTAGTGNSSVSFKNSGVVVSYAANALDAEAHAFGVGSGTITAVNTGNFIIHDAFDGMNLRAQSDYEAGAATVTATNTGTISDANVGINALATTGFSDTTATGVASIRIENTGSILTASTGVIANASANGTGNALVTFNNTSFIDATSSGVELTANNNYGTGNATISGNNTGTINAGGSSGIQASASANLLDATGSGSASTTLSNSGNVTSLLNAMSGEAHVYGNGNATVQIGNSGFLGSTNSSALSGQAVIHSAGPGNAFLSVVNTGTLDSANGTAVDVGAFSDGGGVGNATLSFSNTGSISADDTGVVGRAQSTSGQALVTLINGSNATISTNTLHGLIGQANSSAGTASVNVINNGVISSTSGNGIRTLALGSAASNISIVNTGTVSVGASSAVYVSASTPGSISIYNSGSISGTGIGIRLLGTQANTITLAGGIINTGGNAISGNGASTVTIVGRSTLTNLMDGGGGTSLLNLKLTGMTQAEKAALEAANPTGDSVVVGGKTYTWQNFSGATIEATTLTQSVDETLASLATAIDNNGAALGAAFDPFYVAAADDANAAVAALAGKQILDARTAIALNQGSQLNEAILSRGYQNAAGMQGFSSIGFHVQDASLLADVGTINNNLDSLSRRPLSDSNLPPYDLQQTPEQRWGAWITGTVTVADQDDNSKVQGYEATTATPTVGIDYHVSPGLRVGVMGSYTNTSVDFKDGSDIKADTGTIGVYGTFTKDKWYVTGLAAGGYTVYDNRRQVFGNAADSDPGSTSLNLGVAGGYNFTAKDWTLSPELGVQYTRLMVDGYSETGAGAFNLNVGEQDTDSLRSQVGFRVNRTFDLTWIKLTPSLRAAWYHEFLNDSRGVNSSLGGIGSFSVKTSDPERDFGILGLGLSGTFTENDAITVFLNYNAQVGQDDYLAHTINSGFRYGF